MNYTGVESSLTEAAKIFEKTVNRREQLIKESRDVVALSARSIVCIHNSKFEEAKKLQKEAMGKLENLRRVAGSDMVRYIFPPEQELVECSVVLALSTGSVIPSRKQLRVENSSYILGLLDAIGELKRMVYDTIRVADFKKAEGLFAIMQQLYLFLSPFSIYDHVVQGSKRKLDVARILIEDTRGTITEEARRRELIDTVSRLSTQLLQHSKGS
jgi:translin